MMDDGKRMMDDVRWMPEDDDDDDDDDVRWMPDDDDDDDDDIISISIMLITIRILTFINHCH